MGYPTATYHKALHRSTTYYNVMRRTKTYYGVSQRTTKLYDVLRGTTRSCDQSCTTTCYNILQHTSALRRLERTTYIVLQRSKTSKRTTAYFSVPLRITTYYNALRERSPWESGNVATRLSYIRCDRRCALTYDNVLQRTSTY